MTDHDNNKSLQDAMDAPTPMDEPTPIDSADDIVDKLISAKGAQQWDLVDQSNQRILQNILNIPCIPKNLTDFRIHQSEVWHER